MATVTPLNHQEHNKPTLTYVNAMLIVADAEATSAPPNTLDFHTLMRRSSDEFAIGPTSLFVGALCHEPPQQGYSDLDQFGVSKGLPRTPLMN